jgi:uncharacterized protein (TIGR01777 family)
MTENTNNHKNIVIAGGTGFLGRMLQACFEQRGYRVRVLARRPLGDDVEWDGKTVGAWAGELEGAACVINLAGRSVNCRYTKKNRRAILDSRVESTRVIAEAIAWCERPPAVWMNASTATIYKHTFGAAWDESGKIAATSEAKDAFSIEVAQAWEREFFAREISGVRKVALRAAMVLGTRRGGVLHALANLCKLRLGGAMAGGRQFVSWIHERDFCRAVEFLMSAELSGTVNLAAPNPVTNRYLMRVIREAVGVRIGLPAARWMLELGAFFLRTETELIIKSRRVVPGRLTAAGFRFVFPGIEYAVRDLLPRKFAPHFGAVTSDVEI